MPTKGEIVFLDDESPRQTNVKTTINSQLPSQVTPPHSMHPHPDIMKSKPYYVVNTTFEPTDIMAKRDQRKTSHTPIQMPNGLRLPSISGFTLNSTIKAPSAQQS